MFDWETFRRADGSLDLIAAFNAKWPDSAEIRQRAHLFIDEVTSISPISSRQVAAVVLVNALVYGHVHSSTSSEV